MRPHERELDAEIRRHLALSVRERIEQGEDPEAARLAALRQQITAPPRTTTRSTADRRRGRRAGRAAVLASLMPAARASRVDVLQH